MLSFWYQTRAANLAPPKNYPAALADIILRSEDSGISIKEGSFKILEKLNFFSSFATFKAEKPFVPVEGGL